MRTLVIAIVITISASLWPVLADEHADLASLQALDLSYATAWIEGDADGVMALFTEDATLVPHHGDTPIKGHKAIRNFWFNPDYAPTVVKESRREASEIFVSGNMGVVRGRARLVWEYGGTQTTIPEGNYVMIALRQDKDWRIRLLTWNDDPRIWVQKSIN